MVMKRKLFYLILAVISVNWVFSKTVRVGYYIDAGNFMSGFSDEDEKSGYAYEYVQNLLLYTDDWQYEYVYGYWDTLYEKLLKGEIDLLPDISYSKERERELFYPKHSMGAESYYLYSKIDLNFIGSNYDVFDGKTIYVGKDSYQSLLLKEWMKKNNVNLVVTERPYSEDLETEFNENLFELFLGIDTVAEESWEPVVKVGSSDIYLAVSKKSPEILEELNEALDEINFTYPYYVSNLWAKYFTYSTTTKCLSEREKKWVENHKEIVIGITSEDLPFCAYNEEEKQEEGIVTYILDYLLFYFDFSDLNVSYREFDTYSEMQQALDKGEITAAFPFSQNITSDKENNLLTSSILNYNLAYVFNPNTRSEFMESVAVREDRRARKFVKKEYPYARQKIFSTLKECFDAVLNNEVSGVVINVYAAQSMLHNNVEYEKLKTLALTDEMSLCFAVKQENAPFASMINKLMETISRQEISSLITKYSHKNYEHTFAGFIKANLKFIGFTILSIVVIVLLLTFGIKKLKVLIYFDTLTGLYNRRYLNSYLKKAIRLCSHKKEKLSIILFDLDNFKIINDTYGHDFGDEVLKAVTKTISRELKHGDFAFRWGGEEILITLKTDKDEAVSFAETLRQKIEKKVIKCNEHNVQVTATAGIVSYEKGDTSRELFKRADKMMYEGKNRGKNNCCF